MRLGIDGSNVRSGGGLTYLMELLGAANPPRHGFSQVIVWTSRRTADLLPSRPWLNVEPISALDGPLWRRQAWQSMALPRLVRSRVDILFAPGGTAPPTDVPQVAMSQNLLPFESKESRRYGISSRRIKLSVLRSLQSKTFRRAQGIIFLNRYARDLICGELGIVAKTAVIAHGVSERFRRDPASDSYDAPSGSPMQLLYVSTVDLYKHQWNVAKAVALLRSEGIQLHLDLVGSAYQRALRCLQVTLDELGPAGSEITYRGELPIADLPAAYADADLFVFASSCENLPNILLEAMAAGLPIASSNRGPMPELLGTAAVYFDPEDPWSIAASLRTLVVDANVRRRIGAAAYNRALMFTWARCAEATFAFLSEVGTETDVLR